MGIAVNESLCLGSVCVDLVVMAALQESRFPFEEMPFDGIFGHLEDGRIETYIFIVYDLYSCNMTSYHVINHMLYSVYSC